MTRRDWQRPEREPRAVLVWVKLLLLLGTLVLVIWLMARLSAYSQQPVAPPAPISPTPQSFDVQIQPLPPSGEIPPAVTPAAAPPAPSPSPAPHSRLNRPDPAAS